MTNLISIDDAKIHLPIREGYTDADERINSLIELASLQIEKFTNRAFEKISYTENFRSNHTGSYDPGSMGEFSGGLQRTLQDAYYILGGHPLDEAVPVQVFYDITGQWAAETELTLDTDFFVSVGDRNTKLIIRYPTDRKTNALKVVYTAGYAPVDANDPEQGLTGLPESLKHAASLQVMHLFNKVSPDSISVDEDRSQDGEKGTKFSVTAGLIPEVKLLLSEYVRT